MQTSLPEHRPNVIGGGKSTVPRMGTWGESFTFPQRQPDTGAMHYDAGEGGWYIEGKVTDQYDDGQGGDQGLSGDRRYVNDPY